MKSTATTTEGVDPIKEQHVQVNIQVQRGAEALDQGNGAGAGAGRNSQARVVDQEGRDTALDHRQHLSQYIRLGCEQESQRKRKRQHELTNGRFGKHVIDQVGGRLHHAPHAATGAKPSPLTAKRHQMFVAAAVTLDAQEQA
jgi:hypothetical protein